MKKRNRVLWQLMKSEEDYVSQLGKIIWVHFDQFVSGKGTQFTYIPFQAAHYGMLNNTSSLGTLVMCFYKPLKMAASSSHPPLSHAQLNLIFRNWLIS